MAIPEGYLPRRGDIVVLHAAVKHNFDPGDEYVFLNIKEYDSVAVSLDKIVSIYARHWDVGDKVRVKSNGQCGEVAAVSDGQVWVKHKNYGDGSSYFRTSYANDLDPDVAPPAEDENEKAVQLAIAADAAAVEPAPPPENPADKEIAF